MRKAFVVLGILAAVFVTVGGCVASKVYNTYNELVVMREQVDAKWSQVENVYQRRADLVPNLVNSVRGYAKHESGTFIAVTEARAKVGQMNLKANDLTPQNLAMFQKAQGELSGALSRLMVVVERYPDLKASSLFQDLMVQLEGTENRIAVERKSYNDTALAYNSAMKVFPENLIAGFFRFESKPYFQAEEGAKKVPVVDFEGKGDKR